MGPGSQWLGSLTLQLFPGQEWSPASVKGLKQGPPKATLHVRCLHDHSSQQQHDS